MKKRIEFDSQGKPLRIDEKLIEYSKTDFQGRSGKNYSCQTCGRAINHRGNCFACNIKRKISSESSINNFLKDNGEIYNKHLKTSSKLSFLKDETPKLENIFQNKYWSLYQNDKFLEPLKFSNGKTQEDIVKEIVEKIKSGKKVIFLHGVCGTGKSAIALNVSRILGKSSIIVPIKSLQKQYEDDYMKDKYLLKNDGNKLKIAMITGRGNHDSIIFPGISCADPNLPDTIKINERNFQKIKEYYEENPFTNSEMPELKNIRRFSIAPSNPYWSPILPASLELNHLKDAEKKRYKGINGREFIFYHRKKGCSYYDQYLAYLNADVIIFNSAKYLAEMATERKPLTEVEIIDEADEFLDNLSNQIRLNLNILSAALKILTPESNDAKYSIKKILELIELEERNKRALGIDENKIYKLNETKIAEILKILSADSELQTEINLDETNYTNQALEAAQNFIETIDDVYVSFYKDEIGLNANLVTTNLAEKFKKIVDGNKAIILMSGTLHSEDVLKHLFGIKDYEIVEAETLNQGAIDISRTGTEFDCRYSNFQYKEFTREDYLKSLSRVVQKAENPTLVHVNAFNDLPSEEELALLEYQNLVTQKDLKSAQDNDRIGKRISDFKLGKLNILFTTKGSRGVDFPGKMCNSVVFTKYPNPNVNETFWKILKKTHPDYYSEFYKDKANREFLQRIYRALRSKDDHVYVLSPDTRVLNAVRDLQMKGMGK
ncbi:hypothetical protein HY448_00350 [Candidatus Pacearchaeota archaeon]|nr:hypothetical protein [Candidatus Pacearchaeota archaeon]